VQLQPSLMGASGVVLTVCVAAAVLRIGQTSRTGVRWQILCLQVVVVMQTYLHCTLLTCL
jgi:uncharacterized membrane protein